MLRAHSNSKTKAELLSKALWCIGIENHIGYDKKPFSRFTRNGWAYRYVVRIKLKTRGCVYAEFKSDWDDCKGMFEKVFIYKTNGRTMTESSIRAAYAEVRKTIEKICASVQENGAELFLHPPYIEYTT